MAEQNTPAISNDGARTRAYSQGRQIEYLQTELSALSQSIEELQQACADGTVEMWKGDTALVKLSGGQAFK